MNFQRIAAVSILLAFLVPLFSVASAQIEPAQSWVDAVEADQGHAIPQPWESHIETTTFFPQQGGDCAQVPGHDPCLTQQGVPGGGHSEHQHMLYDPGDAMETYSGPIEFTYPALLQDIRIFDMEVGLMLASGDAHDVLVELLADDAVIADTTVSMTGLLPNDPLLPVIEDCATGVAETASLILALSECEGEMFQSTFTGLPTAGLQVSAGSVLKLRVSDDSGTTPIRFSFGDTSDPTFFRITTESAHTAVWTEETVGTRTNVFPIGAGVSAEDRAFDLFVAHGNAFGDQQLQQDGGGRDRYHHHVVKEIIGPSGQNLYGVAGAKFVAQNANPLDRLGTNDVPGADLFRYRIFYAEDTEPGTYEVRVGDRRGDWTDRHTISIGGSGVDLRVVGDATHAVNPDEPTVFTFDVVNTGVVPSQVGLSLEGVTGGWGVDIQPPLVQAFPGEPSQVRMTVTPPAGNDVGDVKSFKVRAAAVRDGTSDTADVTVRIVDELTKGVDVFSRVATLTTGPGVTRETFLGVRNTGSFQEDFLVTVSGAPAGWQVRLEPASLDLFAKSDKSVSMRVTAPPNAVAGTQFVATIKAASINDPAITDILELPIAIAIDDGFEVDVFSEDEFIDPATGMTVSLHRMRDEGVDDDVGSLSGLEEESPCTLFIKACLAPEDPFGGLLYGASPWDGDDNPDSHFDETALFRIRVTNTGDRDDTILFEPSWNTGVPGTVDHVECDAGVSGVPDGWRFGFISEDDSPGRGAIAGLVSSAAQISGPPQVDPASVDVFHLYDPNNPHTYTVPAGKSKDVYVQMAWRSPENSGGSTSSCPTGDQNDLGLTDFADGARFRDPSPVAAVDLVASSLNDPTVRKSFRLQTELSAAPSPADRVATNIYLQAQRSVAIQLDNNEVAAKNILSPEEDEDTAAVYRMRAINTGNEWDTLRVSVPASIGGWSYDLEVRDDVKLAGGDYDTVQDSVFVGTTGNGNQDTGTARAADSQPFCFPVERTTQVRAFECFVGVYDEVAFDLIATPPANADIGDRAQVQVRIESKESFDPRAEPLVIRSSSEELTTKIVGSFLYDLTSSACPIQEVPACELDIVPGGTVSMPYAIENKGTAGDDFLIQISKQPAAQTGWSGDISSTGAVFIPAGKTHHGFLTMRAPASADPGDEELFRLKIDSVNGQDTRLVDITPTVVAGSARLSLVGTPADYLGVPGTTMDLTVQATRTSGSATSVTFDALQGRLPDGWTLTAGDDATVLFDGDGIAEHELSVAIPEGEIGNSRVVLPVSATDGTDTVTTELVISLNPDGFGFELQAPLGNEHRIVSGASVQVPIVVQSNVLGLDTVDLSTATLPTGWSLTFDQVQVPLQPLEGQEVIVTVTAPEGLDPGASRVILIEGRSQGNQAVTDTLELTFETARSLFEVAMADTSTRYLAPLETAVYSLTVFNNGTARDDVQLSAGLGPAYQGLVDVTFNNDTFRLEPGDAKTVTARVTLPQGIVSDARVPVDFIARSANDIQNSLATTRSDIVVLKHRTLDVDGDLIDEFAIDRDRVIANGFEQFVDRSRDDGIFTEAIDMATFLDDESIAEYTVKVFDDGGNETEVFAFFVDGDGDSRVDFFLDSDADGLPDLYHDPDRGVASTIDTTKDVTKDGIREYFLDRNGDGFLDGYYDLVKGTFGDLIALDNDGDGEPDSFVVDLDGDGEADEDEPVLLTKDGRVVSISERLDIDGDGRLDSVLDEDGDGKPDCFIPAGGRSCVAIRHQDVTGDGVEDYTYDSNGDGKEDRYYDPATGKTGSIDAGNVFLDNLGKYWYVTALFGLVLVLFVVLVVVTRR